MATCATWPCSHMATPTHLGGCGPLPLFHVHGDINCIQGLYFIPQCRNINIPLFYLYFSITNNIPPPSLPPLPPPPSSLPLPHPSPSLLFPSSSSLPLPPPFPSLLPSPFPLQVQTVLYAKTKLPRTPYLDAITESSAARPASVSFGEQSR